VRQYGISIARQKSIAVKKSSLRQKKKASNSTKVPDKGGECSSPAQKKQYNFAKHKAKFTRERDCSSSPTEEQVVIGKCDLHIILHHQMQHISYYWGIPKIPLLAYCSVSL
jgi:hypothetical protein